MRILFIGDVVGSLGQQMLKDYLPRLKKHYKPQVTIVNGENAADGKGITENAYKCILNAGADVITMGNHTWDKRELFDFIERAPKLVRPANFPGVTPGQGLVNINVNGKCLTVINLQGRVFLLVRPANFPGVTPGQGLVNINVNGKCLTVINLQGRVFLNDLDNPFAKIDELLANDCSHSDWIIVDFHAETTSEKEAFGYYVDGRVAAVIGTHTHVQTNDARILSHGTGYLTDDAGMTGPYNGVLGVKADSVLARFLTQRPTRFAVAEDDQGQLNGCLLDLDDHGHTHDIKLVQINPNHPFFD